MFHSQITRRFVALILLVVVISLACLSAYLLHFFRQNTLAQQQQELLRNAEIIELTLAQNLEQNSDDIVPIAQSISQQTDLRITILKADGTVIADTSEPAEQLDNHLQREEVQAALQGSAAYGSAIRYSQTLKENLMYTAIPVYQQGQLIGVIRTATSLAPVEAAYDQIVRSIGIALALSVIIALLTALWLARRQLQPILRMSLDASIIAHGDLQHRLQLHTGNEFDILAHTINQLTSNLQAMYQRQVDFTGNAAHELKTPLTSISGFAEILCDDDFSDPKASRHYANVIYTQAQRMNHLLADLLQLARLDDKSCHSHIALTKVDANRALLAAATSLRIKAQKKDLLLQITLSEYQPKIKAAQNLLEQVLRNLIDNAIKYTPAKGTVYVSCQSIGENAVYTIKDTGIGIPQASLPRIFERFYRVDKSRARQTGGNGIGLALVKHIVQLFGGRIEVESTLGEGSTFTVMFPLVSSKMYQPNRPEM